MTANAQPAARLSVRQAAFIGVGAMVGAGIFALLGAAGEVAGAAVWLSFLIAGGVAVLQGYSFAKFGARYPSAGGLLEYVVRAFGNGHVTGVVAWLLLATNAIITAMVAVSFGSYASAAFADGGATWTKIFAVLVVAVMATLNIVGSQAVARAQTIVVFVVVGILTVFAIATLANLDTSLLAFSGYPSLRDVVSSVALTFFAFLGFGVITFTAKDLANPPASCRVPSTWRSASPRWSTSPWHWASSGRSPSTRWSTRGGRRWRWPRSPCSATPATG